jgi:hypothetical protein
MTVTPRWRTHIRTCDAEVSRHGESQACEKPAVALLRGGFGYEADWWPVCAWHANRYSGRTVPLTEIIEALGARDTGGRDVKVYIVCVPGWDDVEVDSVYANKTDAEAQAAELNANPKLSQIVMRFAAYVKEFEVEPGVGNPT